MAERRFDQFRLQLEHKVVDLFASVAIGSTGAPTLSAANSKGIASIARNAAGKYTITLQDVYQRLMHLNAAVQVASGVPSTGTNLQCVIRSDGSNSATPTVVIEFLNSAGVGAEIVSGATVLLKLSLKNSTV
jgi:hypothetical protein